MKTVRQLILLLMPAWLWCQQQQQIPLAAISNLSARTKESQRDYLDNFYDRFGKLYHFEDLLIDKKLRNSGEDSGQPSGPSPGGGKNLGGSGTTNAVSYACAGYFKLWYETGSGMDGNSTLEIQRRAILCQVFSDISQFINSPLSSNAGYVQVFVRDMVNMGVSNPANNLTAGLGSMFFSIPLAQNIGGIADNLIWQTIVSGTDAYTNIANPLYTGANNFYHGQISFNFANPNFNWNVTMSSPASNETDMYSVALHEVMHMLGFGSLIDQNGQSKIGAAWPYYTRFDTKLMSPQNIPLITSSYPACSNTRYNWSWNNSLSASILQPGYTGPNGCIADNTNCVNAIKYVGSVTQEVYTPNCFSGGSSLSHFEDQCNPSGQLNNQYFVMANAAGTGATYMKRYPRNEERSAICDMGYSVNNNYGSVPNLTFHSYPGGVCNPSGGVAGINDGITTGGGYAFVTTINTAVNITGVLANDRFISGAGNTFKCMKEIIGTGVVGTPNGVSTLYTPSTPGVHLLRYIPLDANGTEGNITYVYVFVQSGNCTPSNCNIVNNGGFENGNACGQMNYDPVTVDCWTGLTGSVEYFTRNCTANGAMWPVPTNYCVPAADTWDAPNTANNRWIGFFCSGGWTEGIQVQLSSNLSSGGNYVLSFRAFVANSTLASNGPGDLIFGGSAGPIPYVFMNNMTSFPAGITQFASSTIPLNGQWNYFQVPFTVPNGSNWSYMSILSAGWISGFSTVILLDDVSITPANSLLTFTPPAAVCQNQALTNLNQYTSLTGGSFSGSGGSVAFNSGSGFWEFNPGANLALGAYQVIWTKVVNGCSQVLTTTINVVSPGSIAASAPNTNFCANLSNSLVLNSTASPAPGTGAVYTWSPGNIPGQSITVNPQATTTYTVSLQYPNGCVVTDTITLTGVQNCCSSYTTALTTLTSADFASGANNMANAVLYGPVTTSGPPGIINMWFSEFLMAPNAKITVAPGHTLNILSAHLYACGTKMWQGIEVLNGGQIYSHNGALIQGTLIEDAITAIDVNNITAGYNNPPLYLDAVTFNKNQTAIKIQNGNVGQLALPINECIFTSRDLPFTATTWPSWTMPSPGLRFASSPTVGLSSPYGMNNYPFANLKIPFSLQPAQTGIEINNMGMGPVEFGFTYQAGGTIAYNLFDGLGTGVDVLDASLMTMNNVFQNMKSFNTFTGVADGTGIRHRVSNQNNYRLYLTPTTMVSDDGNRFWNCYRSIDANNVWDIDMQYGLFRSDQDVTNIGGFLPGNTGMKVTTNRLFYKIENNEFNNVENGIDFQAVPGVYNFGFGNQTGVYAKLSTIIYNYFGPKVSSSSPILSNEYVDRAISIFGANGSGFVSLAPLNIQSNKINRAFRGISVREMDSHPIDVGGNLIELLDDTYLLQPQYGVEAVRTQNNLSIIQNTISGTGKTFPSATLMFCDDNMGVGSPAITCNLLQNSYKGFDFNFNNPGTKWDHNKMNNLAFGMCLSNGGVIGMQGTSMVASDNEWQGIWMSPDYQTYVDGLSTAASSPLWLSPGPTFWPTVNGASMNDYNSTGRLPASGAVKMCFTSPYAPPPANKSAPVAISTTEADGVSRIELFPNPAAGAFQVKGLHDSEKLHVRVTDVTGKLITETNVTTEGALATIKLSVKDGLYLVQITNEQKEVVRYRLIVEN
jgi:hypothetical protein